MTAAHGSPTTQGSAFASTAARASAGEDPEVLAAELVAQMTDEEKLGCLDGDVPFWEGLADIVSGGIHTHPWPAARIERLGIPGIAFGDGPRGVVIDHATCFPVAMARAATWDPDLEERVGDAIGLELRAVGATLFGGVCVNLLRHPAWGRAQETYGEDPLLLGEMGAALTRGVQQHVMACVKHFACNSIENARFKVDVQADDRTLHEVYLPHFRRIVEEGVAAVMSAYNSVNGAWCGENRQLLTDILREEWGFRGYVISDFIFGLRHPVASVAAGLDIEMPYMQQRHHALPDALRDGALSWDQVDTSVRRIVATLLRFADRISGEPPPREVLACTEHRALARETAVRSIVLLRNELVHGTPLLPLDPAKLRRVAVIGRLAAEPNLGDRGSSRVLPPEVITPLDGLRSVLPDAEVIHDEGADPHRAAELAASCDVAILVVGYTHRDEGEYIDPSVSASLVHLFPPPPTEGMPPLTPPSSDAETFAVGGDRQSLTLHHEQEALVQDVAAANARTVVAVMAGSAVLVEAWHEQVAAILQLWYPGMEGGHALADVLFGHVEPSGRLPFVVPRDAAHLPPFDPDTTSCTYDLWHGQWLLDRDGHEPRYPFGFGLSYSRTTIGDARASVDGDAISVEVALRNEGTRPAPEVLQIYSGLPGSRVERPARRLITFRRVEPQPGQTVTLHLTVPVRQLAVRADGRWQVEGGDYEITVARHARDPDASTVLVPLPALD